MDAVLRPIAVALAELPDVELKVLMATANGVPQVAPGFLAWLEHLTDWEVHRRTGKEFYLQGPGAAIDPSENAQSATVAMTLRELFARDAPHVAALFDAIVRALGGNGARH